MHNNRYYLIAADLLAFLFAYALGGLIFWGIRQPENLFESFYNWGSVYLSILPIGVTWFYLLGHYTRRWPFWDEMRGLCRVVVGLAIIEGTLIFLTKSSFSRIWFTTTFVALSLLFPIVRRNVKQILIWQGKWHLPTVIIGTGENATDVLDALTSERMMGFDVKFFGAPDESLLPKIRDIDVCPMGEDFEQTLAREGISCAIVALDHNSTNGKTALIERMQRFTQDLYVVPAMRGVPLYGMEIHHFFRHEVILLRVCNNLLRPIIRFFKRCFDILSALILITLLFPVLLMLGLLISRDGGPIFFAHQRVGMHGTPFNCLKFRSMGVNAREVLEQFLANNPKAMEEWAKDFKLKDDPRITRIGHFLRNTSLDELPQLWNVLKGDMSLVGPRPLVEQELERYGNQVDYYLQVRPGMTGLWQVSGRNDVEYSHRVYLDVWYVKNWSLWYDIAILFKTFKVVLKRQGAY